MVEQTVARQVGRKNCSLMRATEETVAAEVVIYVGAVVKVYQSVTVIIGSR